MPCFPISLWPGMLLVAPKIGGCGLLERLREHPARRAHVPVLAVGLVLVLGPRADDVAERLAPLLAGLVGIDVEALELGARRRAAGAEVDAPVGDRGRAPRRTPRCGSGGCTASAAAARRSRCGCSRERGDRAVEDLGVRAVRVLLEEVVLDRPERVEPHLLAEHRLLDRVLVRLVLLAGRPRTGDGDLVEQRELHRSDTSRTVVDRGQTVFSGRAGRKPARERRLDVRGKRWGGWTARSRSSPARRRVSAKRPRCGSRTKARASQGSISSPRRGWDEVATAAPGASFHVADVTDEDAVAAAVAAVLEAHGRLDVVVNSAGVAGGGPVHLVPLEEFRRVTGVNLDGTFLVCKHALVPMMEQRSGSIVNIASVEGIEGTEGGSAYNASKGGVVLLTKNMAIDYGRLGIRVNCICPGFIDTPMFRSVIGDFGAHRREVPRPAQARALRPAGGDRVGGAVPRVRRRVVRHRPRAGRRRRVHDRHAHRAARPARPQLSGLRTPHRYPRYPVRPTPRRASTPDGLGLRRRQPLLRGDRRLHPPPRPELGRRIVQWAEIDGRKYHVVGGRVNHAVVNPTFDPIAKAGAMSEYFRGNASGRSPDEYLQRAGADPARIPRPRRAAAGHGRAGRRQDLVVPDARRALRAGARRRPRRCRASCSTRSTGGSRRTGDSRTRTASSPRPTSRWPTSTPRSSSSSGRSTRARGSS